MIFLRAPEPGRVKTRLARDLGDDRALALYDVFVRAVVAAARAWKNQDQKGTSQKTVCLCYTPADKKAIISDWLGRDHAFLAQAEGDMGARMAAAMTHAFAMGADQVVLVGSDIPDITPDHLLRAFDALKPPQPGAGHPETSDLVLGPSHDGGYWLVGAAHQGFAPKIFEDMAWSTASVLSDTLARCRDLNLSVTRLDVLQDVDTAKDLERIQNPEVLQLASL